METKVCSKCNENKSVCEFGNLRVQKMGCCIVVKNVMVKEICKKKYRTKNPEKSKES
jgi:hypothetical protein